MKIKKLGALLVSAALCAGMAAPAFAFEGEATPVEQPILPEVVEDVVTVTDETSGALTPEGNLTLVDDYHTDYSDGSGQQFITLVSKSGNTFYLVIDRNSKGAQTVHFMNLVDEADLLALMEEEDALMKNKIIGVCPNCGANVVEREKGWFCESNPCRFVLWKDNAFFKRLGKRLDAHVADKLLRDGRVRLKDCKSAKGKTYNATVLLSCEADGRSKFSLEFEGGC